MPLYFFHLRDGVDLLLDPEGRQMHGAEAICATALREARSIISDDALSGRIRLDQRIDVEDERRTIVHSLQFTDAVEIVFPRSGMPPRVGDPGEMRHPSPQPRPPL